MRTTKDLLELRFKTNNPHGVLLYASGNQGDFISLQMIRGYLIFLIDLGCTCDSVMYANSIFFAG